MSDMLIVSVSMMSVTEHLTQRQMFYSKNTASLCTVSVSQSQDLEDFFWHCGGRFFLRAWLAHRWKISL